MTPTALSMRMLRRQGYCVDVVERWVPHANIRRDCFGIGDLLAVLPDEFPVLVQTTTANNLAARVKKAKASPGLAAWLRAKARFVVHGWKRVNGKWSVAIVELHGEDMAVEVVARPPRKKRAPRHAPGDLFEEMAREGAQEARQGDQTPSADVDSCEAPGRV